MKAFEFLKSLSYLPNSTERGKIGRPSNSEIRRWLIKKSVVINEARPLPNDEISFPIRKLIFFPNGKGKCTMVSEGGS